ncbi:efflux RND transporter periplasmic adaptor subunit [bacterium]|nr:efflux RND transporter periplasmic adaptor subunit [bacterium]
MWIIIVVIVVLGAAGFIIKSKRGEKSEIGATVEVERGEIVEKALAVGSIEPEREISVKSKVSGVVKRIYKNPGESVIKDEPLLEIAPNPTPLEIARAKSQIEMDAVNLDAVGKTIRRSRKLLEKKMISEKEFEETQREYKQAELKLRISKEQFALLEEGSVTIAGKKIESIIKAPISGKILEKKINIGDPVVPLTSYQAGTILMTIADMDSLLFRGTVDEIDVGKLDLKMPARIKIGALPDIEVSGRLERISLKAREENNSRMFPVEISIKGVKQTVLRAGYSANADIIINKSDSVLNIPERVVYYRGDSVYVEIPGKQGTRERVMIEVGLSDAIRVEVKSGLKEGQKVLEKPQKEI